MFSDWCFLSKNLQDPYVNMLAQSVSQTPQDHIDVASLQGPVVLRGIMKHKVMKQCWQQHRDFFYVDTGYFGNEPTARNPDAHKLWHRIVRNDLQHGSIVPRPADRWQRFGRSLPRRASNGRTVIVAAPDDKPCKFYGIDRDQWVQHTVDTLRDHTDRPIVVRERVANRQARMIQQPLRELLVDAHVLVTYNSLSAIEAIMAGVPVIVTAPTHAALPVASRDLTTVESPTWPSQDLLHEWLCHLSYGQFHVSEMASGWAMQQLHREL